MSFHPREAPGCRVAVIGGGISGIVAAYLLQQKHNVTLIEANAYLGGHTHTILVPTDTGEVPVDTGFIVFNNQTYPFFIRFLKDLGVTWRDTDMSFGFDDRIADYQYAGTDLNGLFAQRKNLLNPTHWGFLWGIGQFCRRTLEKLETGTLKGLSLGEYLQQSGTTTKVVQDYVLPMAAAIWSSPDEVMADFPAEAFARFFQNHGLLSFKDRPVWHTVEGGSHAYVRAFQQQFDGEVVLSRSVKTVVRGETGVEIRFQQGGSEVFDAVVVACHADQALNLMDQPTRDEERLLGPWRYSRNRVELHTDPSFLPRSRSAWASWNYLRETASENDLSLTYHMNRLQGIAGPTQYCVTLNGRKEIPRDRLIGDYVYTHPIYTLGSMGTQSELHRLNGSRRTWYCGSYFGYGFHEDAVRSALVVGTDFGVALP